ncbi:MAG: hypothetical protein QG559_1659 [Campylobacterota bacterium]|nr:hypothetical protein [Campylobacterota bacterium]
MDMIYIYLTGTAIASVNSIIMSRKQIRFSKNGDIKLKDLIKFGLPMALQSAFHSMPRQLDIYIIQALFSTGIVGIYSSAKSLYRFFDEASSAAYGLVYPTAVKLIESKNTKTKAM